MNKTKNISILLVLMMVLQLFLPPTVFAAQQTDALIAFSVGKESATEPGRGVSANDLAPDVDFKLIRLSDNAEFSPRKSDGTDFPLNMWYWENLEYDEAATVANYRVVVTKLPIGYVPKK